MIFFRKKIPILLAFLLAGLQASAAPTKKPNIVLILADDVSADMFSCYGQKGTAKTPNIDRIAKEGVQFRTCFAPAICAPSRALFMTGVYANRSGVFRNDMWAFDSRGKLFTAQHSWAKLMQQGGYKTAVAGKWHCGAKQPWEKHIGFDEFCLWEGADKMKSHFGIDIIANGQRKDIKLPDTRYWYPSTVQNGKYVRVTEKGFGPDIRCEFLMDFMERKAKAKQPFVAYWPTVIPHGPYSTTPDAGAVMDIELMKPDTTGMSREEKTKALTEYSRKQEQRFVNLIQYMDKLIGKLINKAEKLGIYENTWFVFCSDNGPVGDDGYKDGALEKMGDHRPNGPFSGGKYSVLEGGTHTPFITYWPGKIAKGTSSEMVCTIDLAASFAALTGVELPKDACPDSFDVMDALLGKEGAKGRRDLVQQDNGKGGNYGFRAGKWKLQRHDSKRRHNVHVTTQLQFHPAPRFSLFDLSKDLQEKKNIADQHPKVLERMKQRLKKIIASGRSRP